MSAQDYLGAIKLKLATSEAVSEVHIAQERALDDAGFFRARLRLVNGDFVEVSEYFLIQGAQITTIEYRFQWMDPTQQQLRKRWDNAPHHPNVTSFPHHIHIGETNEVLPGQPLGIMELVELLEKEIQ